MESLKNTLIKIGLTEKEVEVYLFILSTGASSASTISYRTSIAKNSCRYLCEQLKNKGLISIHPKRNTFYYEAEPPEKILYLLENQERELHEKKESFNRILSKLIAINDPNTIIPKTEFYEGFEGIKHVYEDTLKEGDKMIHAFENAEPMTEIVSKYVFKDYIPRRAQNGVFVKVITPKNEAHIKTRNDDKKFMRETRFFSAGITPIEIEMNIYGNKVALFSYQKEEMFAVILESKAIANSFRSIFEFCWKFAG